MKKIYVVFALSALALASGCRQEEPYMPESPSDGHEVTVTATLGDVSTKTRLGTDTKVYWSPGDAISIFSAGEHKRFVAQNTEPVKIAKFKGRISVITGASDGTAKDYIWGFYPYSQDNVYSEPEGVSETATITATLPSEQTAVAGTFNDGYAVAIGRSETLGISFQNLYSGFWFTLTNRNDIHSVTLSSDQPLAGRFTAGLDASGTPEIKEVVEGSNSITLTAPDGGTFEKGKAYYFVLFPGTYNLTVTASTRTKTGSREIRNLTLQRNNLAVGSKNLDEKITSSGTGFQSILPPDNEVWVEILPEYTEIIEEVKVTPVGLGESYRIEDDKIKVSFSSAIDVLPNYLFGDRDEHGNACNHNDVIKKVYLPESIGYVGYGCFSGCSALEEVVMGDNVLHINSYAFDSCLSLKEINLSSQLSFIGQYVFRNSGLERITIPDSVTSIAEGAFATCLSLARFDGKFATPDHRMLVDGDKKLVAFAPAGLTQWSIPGNGYVETIGASAFEGCSSLAIIEINAGIKKIEWSAFYDCGSLTDVFIPYTVEEIGSMAFAECPSLNYVSLEPLAVPAVVD